MNFAELCASRYSLRKFSSKPVEDEKLAMILEAGRAAPTAHNFQPQRFFVIRTPENLEKIDACAGSHFAPPVVIVICYDKEKAWKRDIDGKNHGEIDASLAAGQMMLEAHELGLGTTYVGMFDPEKVLSSFPQMEGLTPIGLLPLGYPAEGAHPSRLHNARNSIEDFVTYL